MAVSGVEQWSVIPNEVDILTEIRERDKESPAKTLHCHPRGFVSGGEIDIPKIVYLSV